MASIAHVLVRQALQSAHQCVAQRMMRTGSLQYFGILATHLLSLHMYFCNSSHAGDERPFSRDIGVLKSVPDVVEMVHGGMGLLVAPSVGATFQVFRGGEGEVSRQYRCSEGRRIAWASDGAEDTLLGIVDGNEQEAWYRMTGRGLSFPVTNRIHLLGKDGVLSDEIALPITNSLVINGCQLGFEGGSRVFCVLSVSRNTKVSQMAGHPPVFALDVIVLKHESGQCNVVHTTSVSADFATSASLVKSGSHVIVFESFKAVYCVDIASGRISRRIGVSTEIVDAAVSPDQKAFAFISQDDLSLIVFDTAKTIVAPCTQCKSVVFYSDNTLYVGGNGLHRYQLTGDVLSRQWSLDASDGLYRDFKWHRAMNRGYLVTQGGLVQFIELPNALSQ